MLAAMCVAIAPSVLRWLSEKAAKPRKNDPEAGLVFGSWCCEGTNCAKARRALAEARESVLGYKANFIAQR